MTKTEREENKKICNRATFLRELLKEFGAVLCGFDPGASAMVKGVSGKGDGYWGEQLSFDGLEWKWLEPLLVELRERRGEAWR